MKSKSQVINENPNLKNLINAVISKIGVDSIQDVNNHGIDGGFSGFIHYKDTAAFYRKHRKIINQMVLNLANDFGENPIQMVTNFNCIKDDSEQYNAGKCIYGGKLNDETFLIENALAWFAAEEICRMFDE